MNDEKYEQWWQLHIRAARGKSLNAEEQSLYGAGVDELDREEADQLQFAPLTQVEMSPRLLDVVRTTNDLSAPERLFLAKVLLESLVIGKAKTVTPRTDAPVDQLPTLEEIVAEIKATPPNPRCIQRATQTIDEVMTHWAEIPPAEPRLTVEEWEQSWWSIRQEIKQRDQMLPA